MDKILRATIDDLELIKDIRLKSLKESPEAFTSTYDIEIKYDDDWWRNRISRSQYFLAKYNEGYAGISCCISLPEYEDDKRKLVSMWVDPKFRGFGVATLLINDTKEWAKDNNVSEIELDVFEENIEAKRLYEKNGFVMTRDNNTFEGCSGFYHTYLFKV